MFATNTTAILLGTKAIENKKPDAKSKYFFIVNLAVHDYKDEINYKGITVFCTEDVYNKICDFNILDEISVILGTDYNKETKTTRYSLLGLNA